jgi:hypothetical protein
LDTYTLGFLSELSAQSDDIIDLLLGQGLLNHNHLILFHIRIPKLVHGTNMNQFPRHAGFALPGICLLDDFLPEQFIGAPSTHATGEVFAVAQMAVFFVAIVVGLGDANVLILVAFDVADDRWPSRAGGAEGHGRTVIASARLLLVKEGIERGLSSYQTGRGGGWPSSSIVGHQGTGSPVGGIMVVIRVEPGSPGQWPMTLLLGQALFEAFLLATTRTLTFSFSYRGTTGNGSSFSFPEETVGIPTTTTTLDAYGRRAVLANRHRERGGGECGLGLV